VFQEALARMNAVAIGVAVGMIRAYRLVLVPVLPSTCRFEPSCSRYTEEAIRRYGVFRGTAKGMGRILRCHPFHPGGFDPLEPSPPTGSRRNP
jgi:hypothetical protein